MGAGGVVGQAADAGAAGEPVAGEPVVSGAGPVAGAGRRMAFRHGLIRQVLYDGMPEAVRAALHLQAARALASAGAGPERIARPLGVVPHPAGEWGRWWRAECAPRLTSPRPQRAAGGASGGGH